MMIASMEVFLLDSEKVRWLLQRQTGFNFKCEYFIVMKLFLLMFNILYVCYEKIRFLVKLASFDMSQGMYN